MPPDRINPSENAAAQLSPAELHAWLEGGKSMLLLDVMDEQCFAEGHIPGAKRACVYEATFADQARALTNDTGIPIVVYGTSPRSRASQVAAEKLLAAGYTQVHDMHGGLEAWTTDGYPVQSDRQVEPPVPRSGTFALDLEKSVVRWTGRNLLNHHEGTVRFASGEIVIEGETLTRVRCTVDLRTIACTDLTDATWNAMLIRHLMDSDFFEVTKWPLAEFTAVSIEPESGAAPGSPNYQLAGRLTLRGQTHELQFTAVVGSLDGAVMAGQAEIDLDRTRWGALYGSGKYFERLGKHLVNDLVHLHVKLLANRTGSQA